MITPADNRLKLTAIACLLIAVLNFSINAQQLDAQEINQSDPRSVLAKASLLEKKTIDKLINGESWPRKALAAMRLERYSCNESLQLLEELLKDEHWQVRAFATRSLGKRREPSKDNWFATENEPKVIRSALRYRYKLDNQRVGRGVRFLAKSGNLQDKLLAAELGSASGDEELIELATETVHKIILRMNRINAGALSPRLANLTGARKINSRTSWQNWLQKTGRSLTLKPALAIAPADQGAIELGLLASLDSRRFADLESYIQTLSKRSVDLAICLDCTASMSGELVQAQSGIDDMMLFIGDIIDSLRVGIVAYRDRSDKFETKAMDLTSNIDEARRALWGLSAEGGGDTPESVHPALKLAFTKFSWRKSNTKVLILIGDAPPKVGTGIYCISLAKQGATLDFTTHVIQASGGEVKHFREIAEAGEGKCVNLSNSDSLIAQITGLTLGDQYQDELDEFFHTYIELCR